MERASPSKKIRRFDKFVEWNRQKEISFSLSLWRHGRVNSAAPGRESMVVVRERKEPRVAEDVRGRSGGWGAKRSRGKKEQVWLERETPRGATRVFGEPWRARLTHTHPRVDEACGTRGHGRGGRALAEPPLDALARKRIAIRASVACEGDDFSWGTGFLSLSNLCRRFFFRIEDWCEIVIEIFWDDDCKVEWRIVLGG